MKYKTLILLLILCISVIAIYTSQRYSPVQKRSRLFDINPDDIHAISMSDREDSLYIKKDIGSNDWYTTCQYKIRIAQKPIDNFFTKVLNIQKFDKILTSSPSDFYRYNVTTQTGKRVVMYDENGTQIVDILLGIADILSYGTARITDQFDVYEIAQNIMHDVSPILSHWRIQEFFPFDRDGVDSLWVWHGAIHYRLTKEKEIWHYADKNEKFAMTEAHLAIHRAFTGLENLRTMSYIDGGWDTHQTYFQEPILKIQIFTENQIDSLTFGGFDDRRCIIKVNDDTDTLYFGTYDTVNRWTITKKDFEEVFRYSL